MTCPACGTVVTGKTQNLSGERSPDNKCACLRIRFVDGEFYERIADRTP